MISRPWYVLRDFNTCLEAYEKIGSPPLGISCREFVTIIDDCDFSAIDTLGEIYTWMGHRGFGMVQVCLDRALCSAAAFEAWSVISCITLSRHGSDYNPLLLCYMKHDTRPFLFWFRNMWITHEFFLPFVQDE